MGCGSSKQTKVEVFKPPNPSPEILQNISSSTSKINLSRDQQVENQSEKQPEIKLETSGKQKINETNEIPYTPHSYVTDEKEAEDGATTVEVSEEFKKTFFTEKVDYDKDVCRLQSVTKPTQPMSQLTILHFNDVYNIEPRDKEPVGGAARFVTKVHSFKNDPLVLFSGDCLNPSLMSSITRGKQMLPIMNAIGVHAAVYGNHDFDFGVDELVEFKNKTTFPWLLSNVQDKLTKTLLADGIKKIVCDWHGRKIGIIGLVEQEWLATLSTIDADDVEYFDFIKCARQLVQELREEEKCELVIALTHMRVPNDIKLLESDIDIDLILGGHDHHYETKQHEGKQFVKSGTDFRELTEITIDFTSGNNNRTIATRRHEITADIEEDETIKRECEKYLVILGDKMEEVLGVMQVDLDGRFSTVRLRESNLGNFVCDVMRAATQTDIALLNSGSLRSDVIHPAGPFKMKDLTTILPMVDSLVVLKVKGQTLVEALENSVSQYPKYEGRFLQVSGISFVFDPLKPAGDRISKDSIMVHGNIPLQLEKEYTVVTKEYLARGKDGYDMLTSCEVLVDEENGAILHACIENHFESIRIYKGKRKSVSGHRQSITVKHDEVQSFMEQQRSRLSPMVEGRIRQVGDPEILSPSYMRRKSKLRVRTSTVILSKAHSEGELKAIPENDEKQNADTTSDVEEIESQSDSDIDSVMECDEAREQISEDDRMNLWEACRVDDIEKVKEIVGGKSMDFKYWVMEKTLLHHASQHNSIKCLEYIIKETNLKIDVRDQILKGTALFYAAEHGSKEAAILLIDNGASVNAKNTLWETPLHVACENEMGEIIIVLLNRGADRTVRNKEGEKPKI